MSVQKFSLKLEKEQYWSGELVRGTIILTTSGPIKCRAVRVRLNCKSVCHWHKGSGDNRKDYHNSLDYTIVRQTVFGNFYPTPVLDEAGSNAYFEALPSCGDMKIPLLTPETLSKNEVAVRFMDYDWGKRDDLLGEIILDFPKFLQEFQGNGGKAVVVPLMRKGKAVKGEAHISVWILNESIPCLDEFGKSITA